MMLRLDMKMFENWRNRWWNVPSVQIKLYLRMRTSVRWFGAGCAVKKVSESFVLSRCIVWKYNDSFVLPLFPFLNEQAALVYHAYVNC